MTSLVNINGRIVPPQKATVNIFDHGFLFGDSIYETLRTHHRDKLFCWPEHMKRLHTSATKIRLQVPWSDDELLMQVRKTLAKAHDNQDNYVRIVITRGVGKIGLDPALAPHPQLFIIVQPYERPTPYAYRTGIKVALTATRRNARTAMDPAIKSGNYLNNVIAAIEALEFGASDGVMLNAQGHLTEATTSNLWFIKNGEVFTPALKTGILNGITRQMLLKLAKSHDIPCREGHYPPTQLLRAHEAFISSTLKDVLPITKVIHDGRTHTIGTGKPGPLSKRLLKLWRKEVVEAHLV